LGLQAGDIGRHLLRIEGPDLAHQRRPRQLSSSRPVQHRPRGHAQYAGHLRLAAPPRSDGLIELVMPSGVVVRMDAHVDGRALRRILGALEER
jgi:hypothetical protein